MNISEKSICGRPAEGFFHHAHFRKQEVSFFFSFFFLVLWRSFLPKFSILMNFYLFIVNIRFICDGEIYLLTYLLTYQVLLKLIYVILSILVHSDNMLT